MQKVQTVWRALTRLLEIILRFLKKYEFYYEILTYLKKIRNIHKQEMYNL